MTVRLDRALSKLGLASRLEARGLIVAGRVTIDARIATNPGQPVTIGKTKIAVDEVVATGRGASRVIVFHKPRGVVTTRRDPEGRPTVFDALGGDADGLIAIGRLDLASSGLLLLTNDSQIGNWLTDPANEVIRCYVVTVRGEVSDDQADTLTSRILPVGRRASDGLRASNVTIHKRSRRETHLIVDLTEGKNREIRRLFGSIDHEVTRLLRVSFGPIELGTLQPGQWREASSEELQRLRTAMAGEERAE